MKYDHIRATDPEAYEAICAETVRQEQNIEMIASENIVSEAVMEAVGSVLTNKYAEGYPGKRYYGGCQHVDVIEDLARERLKALFGADHANVQPHSGANANEAVYQALLNYGDTVLGMDLSNGGHLTHGSEVNFSGKSYHFVSYGIDPATGRIDYGQIRRLAMEHRPKLIVAGASAYPRIIDPAAFREIADEVGAVSMFDMAHIAGLVAAGHHPNPAESCQIVTTTTHKTLRGPRGGAILCQKEYSAAIDKAIFPGFQGGPLMHVIAGKAVCFKEAAQPSFRDYIDQVVRNAQVMAESLLERGFELVTGGTDNHLVLVNLINKGVTGRDAERWLDLANITTNKNAVPNDPQSPFVTSGLRLGTPAMTSRGFREDEVRRTIEALALVIDQKGDEKAIARAKGMVAELTAAHPTYGDRD